MRINTNVNALLAWRNLNQTNWAMAKTIERLSSGYRINRAADDAAGLAIASGMMRQIRGLRVAQRNALDAISLVQTAEGGAIEIENILQRLNELANQAASDGVTDSQRRLIQEEVDQLVAEIQRIATTTNFNGTTLLDGSLDGTTKVAVFQVGTESGETIALSIDDLRATALGLGTDTNADNQLETFLDVSTRDAAETALNTIKTALETVSQARAKMGAYQNRFEATIRNLGVTEQNLSEAHSRIRDADVALEMAEFTRQQILLQAGTAMLAQANVVPQTVLRLLAG